jgi:hypothetical protein
VRKTTALLRSEFGAEWIGLARPWCYRCELRDGPDILQVLWEEGIRFTRTDERNEPDWHPVAIVLQPYWCGAPGFSKMLDTPIHDWHDCVIRGEFLGWADLNGYMASVRPYFDRAAAEDAEPQVHTTEAILWYAQDVGLRWMSYREFYGASEDRRPVSLTAPQRDAPNHASASSGHTQASL